MSIKLVSDVHGAIDKLLQSVATGDTLILLGDLLDILDFEKLDGLLPDIYSKEKVQTALDSWVNGNPAYMRNMIFEAFSPQGKHYHACRQTAAQIYSRYTELPCQTYVLPGNVDFHDLLQQLNSSHIKVVGKGETITIEGRKFGFVGGGLSSPMSLPGELPAEIMTSIVSQLGPVDILCSHIPPDLEELTYDTKAKRHEKGSAELADYIIQYAPSYSFFGHVHNPLKRTVYLGNTLCYNTGFFKHTGQLVNYPLTP